MRISEHNRYMIKKTILSDLYGSHQDKLEKEKEAFLRKNLALEFAPYTEYIAKIPDHLLNIGYRYSVRVPIKRMTLKIVIAIHGEYHYLQMKKFHDKSLAKNTLYILVCMLK